MVGPTRFQTVRWETRPGWGSISPKSIFFERSRSVLLAAVANLSFSEHRARPALRSGTVPMVSGPRSVPPEVASPEARPTAAPPSILSRRLQGTSPCAPSSKRSVSPSSLRRLRLASRSTSRVTRRSLGARGSRSSRRRHGITSSRAPRHHPVTKRGTGSGSTHATISMATPTSNEDLKSKTSSEVTWI